MYDVSNVLCFSIEKLLRAVGTFSAIHCTGCLKKENDTICYYLERKWCHFFWDTLYIHLWYKIVIKTTIYVDKLFDPDPTVVEFFESGLDRTLKSRFRIRIQKIGIRALLQNASYLVKHSYLGAKTLKKSCLKIVQKVVKWPLQYVNLQKFYG